MNMTDLRTTILPATGRSQAITVVHGLMVTSARTGEVNKRPAYCESCGTQLAIGQGIRWAITTGNGGISTYRHLCPNCDPVRERSTTAARQLYDQLKGMGKTEILCLNMASKVENAMGQADQAAEYILTSLREGVLPAQISVNFHLMFSRWNNKD